MLCLMDKREATGGVTIYEAADVTPRDFDGEHPYVTYRKDGVETRIDCDFIAGCDGYHGIARKSAPEALLKLVVGRAHESVIVSVSVPDCCARRRAPRTMRMVMTASVSAIANQVTTYCTWEFLNSSIVWPPIG